MLANDDKFGFMPSVYSHYHCTWHMKDWIIFCWHYIS